MSQECNSAIVAKVRAFPAISGSTTRMLALLSDPNSELSQVESELRSDPGMTANLLKIANSSYFGCPGAIASARDAIMRLGTKRVFQLMLASSVSEALNVPLPGYGAQPGQLWRHSIAVSVAAEEIAAELDLREKDEVFTAALLHDVGKLVLGEFLEHKSRRVDAAASAGESLDATERECLGVDHAEVGALILDHWALPSALVDAARWHHRPEELEPRQPLVDVVHVADLLCMSLGFDEGQEGLQYEISQVVMERLGLRRRQLDQVAIQIIEGVGELSEAMEINA